MFTRVRGYKEGLVPASADQVWTLLMDFAGHKKWWLTEAEGGRPGPNIERVELIGEPTAVPRTRRIHLETGAIVDETLMYQNHETRRIYYDMQPHIDANGNAFRGAIVGYLCSTTVDEAGPDQARMVFESQFDVRAPADPEAMRLSIEGVHEFAILKGFTEYFRRPENRRA